MEIKLKITINDYKRIQANLKCALLQRTADWERISQLEQELKQTKKKLDKLTKQYHEVASQRNVALVENKRFADLQKELRLEKMSCKGAFHIVDMLEVEIGQLKKKLQQKGTILHLHIEAYNKLQQERDALKEIISKLSLKVD